jgi:hypothetical protein
MNAWDRSPAGKAWHKARKETPEYKAGAVERMQHWRATAKGIMHEEHTRHLRRLNRV